MGDEEEEFCMGDDGETITADPEPGCGQKFQAAIGSCCLGLLLFPLSLFLLGWNERNFVCTQKQIYYAEDNAATWPCAVGDQSALGEDVDDIYFLSCPFDPNSYHNFTGMRFNEPSNTDPNLGNLMRNFQFSGLAARQTTQLYTCVETQHQRTEGSGNERRTVTTYSYALDWVIIPTNFHTPFTEDNVRLASQSCPGLPAGWQGSHPVIPDGINDGTNSEYADGVMVGGVVLPDDWINQIPIDKTLTESDLIGTLPPTPFGARFVMRPEGGEAVITDCGINPSWGCVKLTYAVSTATQASIIANVGPGKIAAPHITPASWACSEDDYYAFYPDTSTATLPEVIAREHSTNSTTAWLLRIVGLLMAWGAVFCLFSPVTFAADICGDCLAFIPCVGEMMEDIIEGVVYAVVCAISCSIGCSCGLCVIAIVMLVMRPLWGGLLMLVALCLIGCSFAVASQAPKKSQRQPQDEEMELVADVDES
jgi:hypothetical protein